MESFPHQSLFHVQNYFGNETECTNTCAGLYEMNMWCSGDPCNLAGTGYGSTRSSSGAFQCGCKLTTAAVSGIIAGSVILAFLIICPLVIFIIYRCRKMGKGTNRPPHQQVVIEDGIVFDLQIYDVLNNVVLSDAEDAEPEPVTGQVVGEEELQHQVFGTRPLRTIVVNDTRPLRDTGNHVYYGQPRQYYDSAPGTARTSPQRSPRSAHNNPLSPTTSQEPSAGRGRRISPTEPIAVSDEANSDGAPHSARGRRNPNPPPAIHVVPSSNDTTTVADNNNGSAAINGRPQLIIENNGTNAGTTTTTATTTAAANNTASVFVPSEPNSPAVPSYVLSRSIVGYLATTDGSDECEKIVVISGDGEGISVQLPSAVEEKEIDEDEEKQDDEQPTKGNIEKKEEDP